MRLIQFVAWAIVIVMVLLPLLRRRRPKAATRALERDELVKDPVCQTYIVRSRAVGAATSSGPPYFCSDDCARRYTADTRS